MVCFPRPSLSLTSPVSISAPGSSALRMLDLPTPELPVKAHTLPLKASRSRSMPSPVSALVEITVNPAWENIEHSSAPASRSVLLMQIISWQPASAAMTDTLSIRNGSVTGFTLAATKISASTLATAGRINQLRLSYTLSIRPLPCPSGAHRTLSPTSGEVPSSRKRPRALHSSRPSAVLT